MKLSKLSKSKFREVDLNKLDLIKLNTISEEILELIISKTLESSKISDNQNFNGSIVIPSTSLTCITLEESSLPIFTFKSSLTLLISDSLKIIAYT